MKRILIILLALLPLASFAAPKKILNVYAWSGEIPDFVINQFEKETGIKVNFSTYENNEIMYTKLKATHESGYDIVMPSSYFVDRMRRQRMLAIIDHSKLKNWHHLNPDLTHPAYDPDLSHAVPFIWGVTGIFYNDSYFPDGSINRWSDLWDAKFNNQLMLLDDTREVFSMTFLSLGYPPNDRNPEHIKAAFLKLQKLMPNVKVFSSDTVISIIIDEDATVGMAWNGDVYKASQENPHVKFVYPKDGFVIWVDNLAIPKNAAHKDAAYQFIDFLLRPEVAKSIALFTNFPIANLSGQKLLPENIRNNPVIYPSKEILRRGQYQSDLDEPTLALYEKYWEALKMG